MLPVQWIDIPNTCIKYSEKTRKRYKENDPTKICHLITISIDEIQKLKCHFLFHESSTSKYVCLLMMKRKIKSVVRFISKSLNCLT